MVNHSPNRKIKTKFTSAGADITLTSLPLYNQANLLSLAYSAILHIWCEKRKKMVIFFRCFEKKAADLVQV